MGAWFNPALWSTADGIVPWPVFDLLAMRLTTLGAAEKLTLASAMHLGTSSGQGVETILKRLLRQAYPGSIP